jgi:hypothetical protein
LDGLRGLAVEASAVVASVRRGIRGACAKTDVHIEIGLGGSKVDGARKSRYSDCDVAPDVTLPYALEDW